MTHEFKNYIDLSQFEKPDGLKPCPFCGSEKIGPLYCEEECCGGKLRWIDCEECGSAMNAETASIEKWNTRPLEDKLIAYARELEERVKELEQNIIHKEHIYNQAEDDANHYHFVSDEQETRIADLERQLAEATQWRSPETAPRDGTIIVGQFPETLAGIEYLTINAVFYSVDDVTGWDTGGDLFADDELLGWFPLPETKKEDV